MNSTIRPFDVRLQIEDALREHGHEVIGAGSMPVELFMADIVTRLPTGEEFTITIEERKKTDA